MAAGEARGARRGEPRCPEKVRKARTGTDRTNFYEDITRKIIAELEAGCVPWVQPWETAAAMAPLALPRNAATRRRYGGINILILWSAVVERGLGQSWLTFRQALSLGGCVRKGERGTTVVYADRFVPAEEMKRASTAGDKAQAIPFLKRFTIFNTDQCDGLSADVSSIAPSPHMVEPRVEALIRATSIDFRIGGDRAFYCPRKTTFRCRLRLPISSRSIGTGPLCMSWRMPAGIPPGSIAIFRAVTVPKNTPSRRSSQRFPLRFAVRHSALCPPCGTSTTSAHGSTCCARIIARLCGQLRKPARSRIIFSDFLPDLAVGSPTLAADHGAAQCASAVC